MKRKKERGKSSGREERERREREESLKKKFLSVAHELLSFSIYGRSKRATVTRQ